MEASPVNWTCFKCMWSAHQITFGGGVTLLPEITSFRYVLFILHWNSLRISKVLYLHCFNGFSIVPWGFDLTRNCVVWHSTRHPRDIEGHSLDVNLPQDLTYPEASFRSPTFLQFQTSITLNVSSGKHSSGTTTCSQKEWSMHLPFIVGHMLNFPMDVCLWS